MEEKYIIVGIGEKVFGRCNTLPEAYKRIGQLSKLQRYHIIVEYNDRYIPLNKWQAGIY